MRLVALTVRAISTVNLVVGRILSYASLGIVVVCFTVVVLRYVFRTGSVPLQDLYVWLNGIMFMGIAGYTLLREGHVRVDVFYRGAATRTKALIDIFGVVAFLAPFTAVIAYWGWPFVERSWRVRESSPNLGGMEGLYVVKSFILVFAAVVALQGLAMLLRGVLVLAGREALLPEHLRYRDEAG